MKRYWLWIIAALPIAGEELSHLGVLSPNSLIPIRSPARGDIYIQVEARAGSADAPHTNIVSFITTNAFLSVEDFRLLPSGPAVLGLKTIGSDGLESPMRLFTFILWKSESLPSPDAEPAVVRLRPRTRDPDSLTNSVRRWRNLRRISSGSPPVPPGLPMAAASFSPSSPPPPLPGGTNDTYANHLDRQAEQAMLRFYSTRRQQEQIKVIKAE